MVVHFPIALITAAFAADAITLYFSRGRDLSKTGFYLLVAGAVSAIIAWGTGQLFTAEPAQGNIVAVFEKHEAGAMITMVLAIAGSVLRGWMLAKKSENDTLKWLAFGISLLTFAAVSFTGFMGGTMVYDYMMPL